MRRFFFAVAALALGAVMAEPAAALEIQVAPATFVWSSGSGSLSVHTDVPLRSVQSLALKIEGVSIDNYYVKSDARGNLVVKSTKAYVKARLDDVVTKTRPVTVELTVAKLLDGNVVDDTDDAVMLIKR